MEAVEIILMWVFLVTTVFATLGWVTARRDVAHWIKAAEGHRQAWSNELHRTKDQLEISRQLNNKLVAVKKAIE